jgi:lysophospholipase L1-like esterase
VSNSAPGHRRYFRIIFAIVVMVLILIAFIAADRAAKRLYARFAPPGGQRAVAALLGGSAHAMSGFFIAHPYLFYTFKPGLVHHGITQFNSRGHRGPEVDDSPPPGVVRILCIGGSTTASFPYVKRPEDAWPGQLERILEERTAKEVEVINAGLNAANSSEILAHYMFRNRYLGAHFAVLHVGGNDGNALFFPNYNPEYTHFTKGWQASGVGARPGEQIWLRSYLVRWLYAMWLRDVSLESSLGRASVTELMPNDALRNVEQNDPEGFRRNLDVLIRNLRADGTEPFLFPFVWAPEKIFRRDPIYGKYYDAFLLGFQKNRRVMEDLAAKHGVRLIVLNEGELPPSVFKDWCHINRDGETIKARRVADEIEADVRSLLARLPTRD